MHLSDEYQAEDTDSERLCLIKFTTKQKNFLAFIKDNSEWISISFSGSVAALLGAYLCIATQRDVEGSIPLLVLAALFISGVIYYLVKSYRGRQITSWYHDRVESRLHRYWKFARWAVYVSITVSIAVFLGVDIGRNNPYNLVSLSGIVFFIVVSFIFSKAPADIPWRTVFCGLVVQLVLGLIVLRWPAGEAAIQWIADKIVGFLNYGHAGARFIFGANYYEHGFAMALMPILAWFNAVISVLLYLGALQVVARVLGGILYFFMGTSPVEAFVAAADIFLGPESSILIIKPMVGELTVSQLHTLLACGLASIDASMIPIFESFGIPARHLLSASCMSAPAALMISKMLFPERRSDASTKQSLKLHQTDAVSMVGAFQQGAREAVPIIANILAFLMTTVSLMEFINTNLTWFGHRAGIEELTLQLILSYILTPVAFLMGVVWEDCRYVASLIGTKIIINEFVAYEALAELMSNREQGLEPSITPRSETIAAYALCGFSNFGTLGMMVAFMRALIPLRSGDITRMAMRALVASTIACMMTGCVAGMLYQD